MTIEVVKRIAEVRVAATSKCLSTICRLVATAYVTHDGCPCSCSPYEASLTAKSGFAHPRVVGISADEEETHFHGVLRRQLASYEGAIDLAMAQGVDALTAGAARAPLQ